MARKPYASASQPPNGGPTTPTIMNRASVRPKTLARFCSEDCSAMKAEKLGPISERVMALKASPISTKCQVGAIR